MKKVLISVIAIIAVFAVASTTFAASVLDDLEGIKIGNNATIKENENINEIENGAVEKENKNLSTNNNVAKNTNENLPTTTPHTGVGDYSSAIFILVFAASAVYAYKKIKDYNI